MRYKGKWTKSRLTAKTISLMMGVEVTKAKRLLYGLKRLGVEVDESVVGFLVFRERLKELEKRL